MIYVLEGLGLFLAGSLVSFGILAGIVILFDRILGYREDDKDDS